MENQNLGLVAAGEMPEARAEAIDSAPQVSDTDRVWECRGRALTLTRPVVMGILNVTPDSFSDGGKHFGLDQALAHGRWLLADGAAIVDIGGESTRPGFTPVSAEEEIRRVIPVVKGMREAFPDCFISVDTMKATVAEAAIEAGADIINDVSGAADPRMLDVVRDTGAGLVLMQGYAVHVGYPREAQPGKLGRWVVDGLKQLVDEAVGRGIPAMRLVVDPGFGFGKRHAENAEVLKAVPEMVSACRHPVLIGGSRKHFVNGMYPEEGGDTVAASVRFAVDAYKLGGNIFRVHDVVETCRAFTIPLQ